MNENQRLVLIAYVATALLGAMVLDRLFAGVLGAFGVRHLSLLGPLTVTQLLAFVIAVGGVLFAWRHPRLSELSNEVASELRKVTWPTMRPMFSMKAEVWAGTYVVIVTVVVVSLILGAMDFLWGSVTNLIYGG